MKAQYISDNSEHFDEILIKIKTSSNNIVFCYISLDEARQLSNDLTNALSISDFNDRAAEALLSDYYERHPDGR